ncbi:MAG: FkbM family methyltransferase [Verrucomicrobiota bacterium]
MIWEFFGKKQDGFFVEIGANDPFEFSQTWFFERQGWSGLLVEPLSARAQLLREKRPRSRVFQVALGAPEDCGPMTIGIPANDMFAALRPREKAPTAVRQETVEVTTFDKILAQAGSPKIDFLSIDVEGMELEVLRGFSLEKVHPSLMLIEDHLKSLSVHRYVTNKGYRLVKRTGCNNWYVPAGTTFNLTSFGERLALWRRVNLNTPINIAAKKLRVLVRGH